MARKIFTVTLMLLFSILLCSVSLWGQSAKVDFTLSGRYEGGKTYLKWIPPAGDSVRYFLVYRGQTTLTPSFIRIDSTSKTEAFDQPLATVNSPLLIYYVVAVMKNGTLRYSNMVNINAVDIVRITSKPAETATINVQYSYQVSATTTDPSAKLKFQLALKPDKISIDSVTGLVRWNPEQRGAFKAAILVTSTRGGRADQSFSVTVSGPTGTVAGTVTDSLGNPLSGVTILLYQKGALQNLQYKAPTDSTGKYAISRVDSGDYLARAIPSRSDLLEQWYDGVTNADKATVFTVKPNSTTTVNFKLGAKSDLVRINSKPPEGGLVGVLYSYQVIAASTNLAAELKYSLSSRPSGMTIDSVSGLVKWIPDQKGTFKAAVFVTSTKGGQAEQSFAVAVSGPTGTVTGVVTDELGKPISGVAIRVYNKNVTQYLELKGGTDSLGKYTISRVDTGTYIARATPGNSSYVEQWYDGAFNADNATPFQVKANTTTTVNFNLVGKIDVVRITSKPVESAIVNVQYSYQVAATSTDPNAKLKFQLTVKPARMSIDSVSGVVKWTPDQKGIFKVGIVAISSKGGKGEQSYAVTVSGVTGTVSGLATDTLGKPIAGIIVRLYQMDIVQSAEIKGVTDSLGTYTITKVDSGKYVARATPSRGDFLEQWYDGATTSDKATIFLVTPNRVATVNFRMKTKAVSPQFTVSGTVLDDAKKPIKEASVVFTTSAIGLNNGTAEYVFKARVDTGGKYSLKLPQNTYAAMASAVGFVSVFFDGKSDMLTANKILLTKETTGINFVLKKISSVSTGKIIGSVVDSATKAGLRSRVIAYRNQSAKAYLDAPGSFTTDTDSAGAYALTNLPPGDYIVFALPSGYYTPTFYSSSGPTRSWEKATRISINGNTVSGIIIPVNPLVKNMAGYAYIRGIVSINGSPVNSSDIGSAAGAIVYALINSDDVAGYGITDENGHFAIQELAPGSYTLVVTKVNFVALGSTKASPTYVSAIDATAEPATALLVITPVAVTAVENELSPPSGFVLEQNYPNPFNPSTTIKYTLPVTTRVKMEVISVLGEKVVTLVDQEQRAGTYEVRFNATALPSGTYFCSMVAGDFRGTRKIILLK